MLEVQFSTSSSTEVKDEGYSPSPLFKTPCVSGVSPVLPRDPCHARSPLFSPPYHTSSLAFSLQDCVWREFPRPRSGLGAVTDGRFTPIPSLTLEEPPHLPI
jgi:hypothetical protein